MSRNGPTLGVNAICNRELPPPLVFHHVAIAVAASTPMNLPVVICSPMEHIGLDCPSHLDSSTGEPYLSDEDTAGASRVEDISRFQCGRYCS